MKYLGKGWVGQGVKSLVLKKLSNKGYTLCPVPGIWSCRLTVDSYRNAKRTSGHLARYLLTGVYLRSGI